MNSKKISELKKSIIAVNKEHICEDIHGLTAQPTQRFVNQVASSIINSEFSNRFCFIYNCMHIYLKHTTLSQQAAAEQARVFYKNLFIAVHKVLNTKYYSILNPFDVETEFYEINIDGFQMNKSYKPIDYEGLVKRDEFYSIKCLHFDSAETFISNIYGPFKGVSGGYPIVADILSYCQDNNVDVKHMLKRDKGYYTVSPKKEHNISLLRDYSLCLKFDFENDVGATFLLNEPSSTGIAHAASILKPTRQDATRPIRHVGFCYKKDDDLMKWYRNFNVDETYTNSEKNEPVYINTDNDKINGVKCHIAQINHNEISFDRLVLGDLL